MRATAAPDDALIEAVRTALAGQADATVAAGQQRYMKSAMPYHGIRSSQLRATLRPVLAAHRIAERATWEATVLSLWDEATHREQRYAATTLAGHRFYRTWQDSATMLLYEHLVRTGAWWDHVDDIASHHVGFIVASHRDTEAARMRTWAASDSMWVRRTAILCQLGHGDRLDTNLLRDVIDANLEGSRFGSEFFVRKAIGWALRQHARIDAPWVEQLVAARGARLSGLSRREALKHLH